MNILLIYPSFPVTHWNFRHVLNLVSKRTTEPPLGLLTISSMLPADWSKRLIDMNVERLTDRQILWADMVFISGMVIQRPSFEQAVERCNRLGVTVVAGGPMVTEDYKSFPGVDHFVLNEAEITLPQFLADLKSGGTERVYSTDQFPDISVTPAPDWSLINFRHYVSIDLQYSRGCPYNCEFCSITALFGRRPRVKETGQFLNELDSLYEAGWRSSVFIVDDNFIGDRKRLKTDFLPELISWQQEHGYPFSFNTEVSINLSDDEELMDMMIQSGFTACFVGIETPEDDCLAECGKKQNRGIDLVGAVKRLQRKGFNVSAGFIVGFDSDDENIFRKQFNFIQESGIVNAMIGLLNAPLGTRLYKRLESEDRIIADSSGNNIDGSLNFIPKMNRDTLVGNYRSLVKKIYSPENYFKRVVTFLNEYNIPDIRFGKKMRNRFSTAFKVFMRLGLFQSRGKKEFWSLIRRTIKEFPEKILLAVTLAVYGLHFRKVADSL